MLKSSWLPSSVLIFGQTSVHALIRPPLTVQVESLLEDGRLADAEELLDKATISGIQVWYINVLPCHRLADNGSLTIREMLPPAGDSAVSASVCCIQAYGPDTVSKSYATFRGRGD